MSDDPSLSKAYDLKTPADSVRLYRDWAETYDSGFVVDHGYELHARVAETFANAGGQGPVLDIGAGTGLCGAVLKTLGIDALHATDISPEMLAVAARKGDYDSCITGDILAGLPIADDTYAGAVSSGTFTHGHVGPAALVEVLRVLRPGGLAVLSINAAHYVDQGFDQAFARLRPGISSLSFVDVPIYKDDAQGPNAKDTARLAIFRKSEG